MDEDRLLSASRVGTLYDTLAIRAQSCPDMVPLFVADGPALSFESWLQNSDAVAHALNDAGVRTGDVVVLDFTPAEWVQYVVTYVAAHRLGACVVVRRRDTDQALRQGLGLGELHRVRGSSAAPPAPWHPVTDHRYDNLVSAPVCGPPPSTATVSRSDCAEILFSSGSTGVPHQIRRTFGEIASWEVKRFQPSTTPRVHVHYAPTGTNASQKLIYRLLANGDEQIVELPRFSPQILADAVLRYRAGSIALVPSSAEMLLRSTVNLARDLATVKIVNLHSDFISPELLKRLSDAMPQATIYKRYGLTEAGLAVVAGAYDPSRPLRIGFPQKGTELRIIDDHGEPVPNGVVGCVSIRYTHGPDGPTVPWVSTEDRGLLLADGSLELMGRNDDFLVVGSSTISLKFAEAGIRELEGVADVAVVPIDKNAAGSRIGVLVVPEASAVEAVTAAETWIIDAFALPAPRVTARAADSIPRTLTGKTDVPAARAVLTAAGDDVTRAEGGGPGPGDLAADQLVLSVVHEIMASDHLRAEDDLWASGVDSSTALRIVAIVEERSGLSGVLDLATVFECETFGDLASHVAAARSRIAE